VYGFAQMQASSSTVLPSPCAQHTTKHLVTAAHDTGQHATVACQERGMRADSAQAS
jgi:hypothetical protein